jgi:hypothetical protein
MGSRKVKALIPATVNANFITRLIQRRSQKHQRSWFDTVLAVDDNQDGNALRPRLAHQLFHFLLPAAEMPRAIDGL